MPTYTYMCKTCNSVKDVFHSMTRNPHVKCPKCGNKRMSRLLGTGAAVIFKGSGFYETDYKRNGSSKSASSESSSESKSEAKSETKPAKTDGKAKASSKESK